MSTSPPPVRSRLLVASLLLWVIFLGCETIIRIWDLYRIFPPIDILSHLLAGLAIGALSFHVLLHRHVSSPVRWSVVLTGVVALLWEGIELIQEHFWPDPPWLQDVFLWDGFWDVVVTVLGGVLVFPLLRWMKRSSRFFEPLDV